MKYWIMISAWRKAKQKWGLECCRGIRSAMIQNRMVREGHSKEVPFEQRPKRGEGGSQRDIYGE